MKSNDADFPLTAQDYRVTSSQPKASIDVPDSPIVFVGYGIVAPEYKWDDYKGIDVKGKAVMILCWRPAHSRPCRCHPSSTPKCSSAPSSPIYGRAGSKADIAFARGATAVITLQGGAQRAAVAERAAAQRVPDVARTRGAGGAARGGANSGPNRFIVRESMIVRDASSTQHIAATVSLNNDKATEFFAASGEDLAALRASALSPDFKPVPLKASIAVHAKNEVREIESNNVVAKIEGSDPELRNEYVIYSGHWDHLGHSGREHLSWRKR